MQKKYAAIVAVVAILAAVIIIAAGNTKKEVKAVAPLVRTQVIRLDGSGQGASYSGEVRGRFETPLSFQVSGKIVRRNVELGSSVQAGDALLEIDSKDIQQTVNITSAQVYSAQSQLNLAETNLERYRRLYEQGAVSQAQYDQYRTTYDAAVASVRQTSAQYAQGSNQLGYSVLCADAPGVVASIGAEVGQVVSAGQSVVTLVRDGEREVEISIPENRIEELGKAQKITVVFWALPGVTVEGKVRELSPIAEKVARTYKARISLMNPPPEVRLGMTANVAVDGAPGQGAVYIPLTAIYQIGDTPGVWLVKGGSAVLRQIRTGNFGDGKVQVLSGLENGDVIITAGVHKLQEGQQVRTEGDAQ